MSMFSPIHPTVQTMAYVTLFFFFLQVRKQKLVGRRFLMDTWSVSICHFKAHDFSPHHSTRKHVKCSWKSWNCIAKREWYFEGMWNCQVNHMIIPAFMFSSPTVIRNGALLVNDCSGCLYYRTGTQVCNLALLFYIYFKSGYIDQ